VYHKTVQPLTIPCLTILLHFPSSRLSQGEKKAIRMQRQLLCSVVTTKPRLLPEVCLIILPLGGTVRALEGCARGGGLNTIVVHLRFLDTFLDTVLIARYSPNSQSLVIAFPPIAKGSAQGALFWGSPPGIAKMQLRRRILVDDLI